MTDKLINLSKNVGYVDESMMISFLAVYEFYHTHKIDGTRLEQMPT